MGVLRESDGSWYMREENGGLILALTKWAHQFVILMAQQMIQNMSYSKKIWTDASYQSAIARVPAFAEVGVKKVYNGAIAYTPMAA